MNEGRQKHHWSSWNTLAKPTAEGGVGFVGLQEMIDAAGAKLWWSFRQGGSLWSEFLMAKYCSKSHPVVKG